MRIGYACLTIGVPGTDIKSCMMKNATTARLMEIITHNLIALERMIDYNIANGILLFRISSDLIPFGSSPVNELPWWELFHDRLQEIGQKVKKHKMRVSMHPGQYTVLNSPDQAVVSRAVEDLRYHARVLDSLSSALDHKIILHIGGVYGDKPAAVERFVENYEKLDQNIKRRLVIENDDKSYTIEEVLEIGLRKGIPVVFDNLHHAANPSKTEQSVPEWIKLCKATWTEQDGPQKIHYSQQNPSKKAGSHSESIRIDEFMEFYKAIKKEELDIMLEVKDKNLSAIKCINCTGKNTEILLLEQEWSRYKYQVLDRSHKDYLMIRSLLKEKNGYPAIEFYRILESCLQKPETIGESVNAAQHVWGYFKNLASKEEKDRFLKYIEQYQQGKLALVSVKSFLWKLTLKYEQQYLKISYYFL